ncbi:MAG TPA: HAD hydrolase-like protein [Acidimicrobiales bacterium]|nr:HAD hydrolase-like protein [Acidimicrobiales bacterium]
MSGAGRGVVLLDVDGCLVDSTRPVGEAIDAALVDHGVAPLAPGELQALIGPPLKIGLAGHLDRVGADLGIVDSLIATYRQRYAPLSIELAASYPGVPEAVAALAAEGRRLAVVTSKPQVFAVPILEALGLDRHLEVMVGPGPEEIEPKTTTMARALALLDPFDPSGSVMVGDRHHDVEAAHAHGLRAIGVLWGFGTEDELRSAGAHAVVADATELLAALA